MREAKQAGKSKEIGCKSYERGQVERELDELSMNSNKVVQLLKVMKRDGRDVEGGGCMRGNDRRINFSEEDRGCV